MPIRSHKIQAHDVDLRPEDIGAPTKEFVEEQLAIVMETGVSKLQIYPISCTATVDNQTVFNIDLESFDKETDTVLVQSGRTMLFPSQDFTINENTVVLNEGVPKDRVIGIYVFKNVPMGKDGSVSGKSIAKNSLPLDRMEFEAEFKQLQDDVQELQVGGGSGGSVDLKDYAKITDVPTKMSQLECDINLPTGNDLGNTILEGNTSFEEPEIDPLIEAKIEEIINRTANDLVDTELGEGADLEEPELDPIIKAEFVRLESDIESLRTLLVDGNEVAY